GVHGANRLASNSLLEGMVFGPRAVEAIAGGATGPRASGAMRAVLGNGDDDLVIGGLELRVAEVLEGVLGTVAGDPVSGGPASAVGRSADDLRHELQAAMSDGAGVLRDERRLGECAQVVEGLRASLPAPEPCDGGVDVAVEEVRNLVEVARVLVAAALARTETRGTHARVDHPSTDPSQAHRLVVGGARSPVQHSTP